MVFLIVSKIIKNKYSGKPKTVPMLMCFTKHHTGISIRKEPHFFLYLHTNFKINCNCVFHRHSLISYNNLRVNYQENNFILLSMIRCFSSLFLYTRNENDFWCPTVPELFPIDSYFCPKQRLLFWRFFNQIDLNLALCCAISVGPESYLIMSYWS
jgi:hypothetical protein